MNSKIKKIYDLNDDEIKSLKIYGHFDLIDYTIEIEKVYMNLVYPAISNESKIYADKKITESNY